MSPGVILYVEDEEDDVFLFRHAFQQTGASHPIISLPDGEAAIHYLKGEDPYANRSEHPLPVLLLLDINLPLVSGLEVLAWLRSQSTLPTLPTLMLSSSSQPSDVEQAYQRGANAYLVKPSGVARLVTLAKAIHEFWLVQNQPPAGFEYPKAAETEEVN